VPAPIEFYFDFSSPYGYLASRKIDELTANYGRETIWRPILLGVIFRLTGSQPLPSIPIKGDYSKRDIERSARLLGVPYRFSSTFPVATQSAARAFYWLSDREPKRAIELARAYYRAFFVDDLNISEPENVIAIATRFGLNEDEVSEAINDPRIKERLKSEIDSAIAKGVFGSPFFIIDGEPFWGADRLDQVEKWLASGGW
jgi:2-hydroxychromene-2-carboxylate isomerase